MQIDKSTFDAMPADLRALFVDVPNPGRDEVLAAFPNERNRFFYCSKTSKSDRGEGNVHPTVKPTTLMRYLCRLVTPPNGIVFDPFAGSGSTGKAAILEGFKFLGFELSPEYAAIGNARIQAEAKEDAEGKA